MNKYSVTEFVNYLNEAFSAAVFPDGVSIEGEVAEYRVSQGKWVWFLLKDQDSVLSCFATTWKMRLPLEDGMQVRIYGVPKIHNRSGKFSIVVDRAEPVGEGALKRAYELLKSRLEQEGLFSPERKRFLPRFPNRIGLIASRESAAYSDFLRILNNRWGGLEINSVHVQVQGRDAVESIVQAFEYFNVHPDLADVLVLTRGGGSLEDLQAFNSEEVARAVFGSAVPVIVGVGHERDESLADYAADVRASTPSNAAEIIVPDRQDFLNELSSGVSRLSSAMEESVQSRVRRVDQVAQHIENRTSAALATFRHRLRDFSDAFGRFSANVNQLHNQHRLLTAGLLEESNQWRLNLERNLATKERLLATLDPKSVLRRGYAIVRSGGRSVTAAAELSVGEQVDLELRHGTAIANITKINSN
ncbi:MAG: exodeoxyribonuclease VII large subunit [Patescibacteria group bacterium]